VNERTMVQVYVDGMSWHRVSIAYVFLALSRFGSIEFTPGVVGMREAIEVWMLLMYRSRLITSC
jgi:hypothetical protein